MALLCGIGLHTAITSRCPLTTLSGRLKIIAYHRFSAKAEFGALEIKG